MDDACPHRLAPLSEGRIDRETDRIECAYHGWSFESSGRCARIPQATDAAAAASLRSPRSCVSSYSTRVEKSVLFAWLWPEDVLGHVADQAAQPETMLAGVDPDASTYTRDLPYGWDTLLENIVDPSHIPFAHHGLQGKREDAIAINMSVPETLGAAGLRFAFGDRTMGMLRSGHGEFRAPFVVQYNGSFPASPRTFNLTVVCVPTTPGWSRAIIFGGTQPEARKAQANAGGSKPKRSLFATIFGLLPTWAIHLGSNRFLDSDLAFLHFQEQTLRERAAGMGEGVGLAERARAYFMPAPADRVIVALHRWLDEYAHVPGPLPPPIRTRAALFDRWTQHTAHCRHCQAAVAGIARWRGRLGVGLGLCLLAAASHWAARLLGVACLGGLGLLGLVEQQFRVSDYKHYKT